MIDEIGGNQADAKENQEANVSTLVAELPSATGGLAVDASGNIFAANIGLKPSRNGREIYRNSPDGSYELWVEGQGLNGASGNTFDKDGKLLQRRLFLRQTILSPARTAVTYT